MNPSALLDDLKARFPRQAKSLDAIYLVCKKNLNDGGRDFSYSNIARLGARDGVPKAQSIRNKTGENYRILIDSFVITYIHISSKRTIRTEDYWVDLIDNPEAKLMANIALARISELEAVVRELIPPNLLVQVDDRVSVPTEHRLNAIERRALEFLLSNDFRLILNLTEGDHDDLVDEKGRKIFKPATMGAIRKSLKYL